MKSLDAFLPSYGFATRPAVAVDADPARADRALREVTFPPATAVIDFRAVPGALTTETRVHVPDRVLVLRAAKRRAEAGT